MFRKSDIRHNTDEADRVRRNELYSKIENYQPSEDDRVDEGPLEPESHSIGIKFLIAILVGGLFILTPLSGIMNSGDGYRSGVGFLGGLFSNAVFMIIGVLLVLVFISFMPRRK